MVSKSKPNLSFTLDKDSSASIFSGVDSTWIHMKQQMLVIQIFSIKN